MRRGRGGNKEEEEWIDRLRRGRHSSVWQCGGMQSDSVAGGKGLS